MATFEYHALTDSGRLMLGTLEASCNEQAGDMLREMNLSVNSLTAVKEPKIRSAIGRSEFIMFNQQLASLTKAGIPLEKGLRELADDVKSSKMKKLILEVADDLDGGIAVETAFEKRKKRFPALYGRIINAGGQIRSSQRNASQFEPPSGDNRSDATNHPGINKLSRHSSGTGADNRHRRMSDNSSAISHDI